MRKLTEEELEFYDCEWCGDYRRGKCPYSKCPYNIAPVRKRKRKQYTSRITIDAPKPVLTEALRRELFPKKRIEERYNLKAIIAMHLEGNMAVEIARKMNLKPQEVGDIIGEYRKGNLHGIF